MNCIETQDLCYRFSGGDPVLNKLNMEVPEEAIYGFLGPNGAGKTTTLKLLLGLLSMQQGVIRIFNQSLASRRIDILKHIGSLIESPSVYGHLSCLENLLLWRRIYQCNYTRVGQVLDQVGLAHAGNKKAGKLSLGMKQRLGIAIALLNQPRLLILDEPTNGLDPNGIIEMRQLLIRLNREQKITIVISSHLLPEVEKIATHLGIISKGTMLFQGTLSELHTRQQRSGETCFTTNNIQRACHLVQEAGFRGSITEGKLLVGITDAGNIAGINELLVHNNIQVSRIEPATKDLEAVFINMINN